MLEGVATHLQLHGNAYVQVLRDGGGRPAALYALRPERVRVEVDASGWPAAYRYTVGDRVQRLIADAEAPEVIHLRMTHPLDDHYGLGCLGAAAGAIAIHNAASDWNRALLDNAARPSGATWSPPSPRPSARGNMPAPIAKLVIRIGRRREVAPSRAEPIGSAVRRRSPSRTIR